MLLEIKNFLLSHQDPVYRDFQCKLLPTIDRDRIIGVRTPILRAFSRELRGEEQISEFLADLPHEYYEENNLHAFLVAEIKEYDRCIQEINRFLPFIDNWATCDSFRPKCFKSHVEELKAEIEKWLSSSHTYTVRFGIEMLMVHFLEEHFDVRQLERVAAIKSNEYYINMMIAWYFATALAKQWEKTLPFIESKLLSSWIHNKTIQKAMESYRISADKKNRLFNLKINSY